MDNRNVRQYFREIKRSIPCIGRRRREILDRIRQTIEGYLEENPSPGYEGLTARFGTPKQIVTACLEEMDAEELLRRLKFSGRIVRIVAAGALAVVMLWAAVVSVIYIERKKDGEGYFVEYISNVTYVDPSNGGK